MSLKKNKQALEGAALYGAPYEPAYLARRFDQIAVSIFFDLNEGRNLTPSQYSALGAIRDFPNSEQLVIARIIAVDRSTINCVTKRLEASGLISRTLAKGKIWLNMTAEGEQLLDELAPNSVEHSERFLAPLTLRQKEQFLHLLRKVVEGNNHASRTPVELPSTPDSDIAA